MLKILGGTVAAVLLVVFAPSAAARTPTFANCAAMHKSYPHGVGKPNAHDHVTSGRPVTNFYKSTAIYNANAARDRDKDGIACEAH